MTLVRQTVVEAPNEKYIEIAFIVKDERGAIHFHFRIDQTPLFPEDGRFSCAGVETHYASAPDYMDGEAPSHENCWILGGPCWHDGTSLWASEHWLPHFRTSGTDWVWAELERRHKQEFYLEDKP